MQMNKPLTLVPKILSKSADGIVEKGGIEIEPSAIRCTIEPAVTVHHHPHCGDDLRLVAEIQGHELKAASCRLDQALCLGSARGVPPAADYRSPLLRERNRHALSDAGSCPGNEGDFSVECSRVHGAAQESENVQALK